jgi:hypothetical protein
MSDPTIKAPTKKAFHFPKAAAAKTADQAKAATPDVAVPRKAATARKSTKAQPAATVKTKPAKANSDVKAKRVKKEKVVRDSFTMPKSDYDKLAALKLKCLEAGVSVKKSELLRAGLLMLESAAPKRLLAAVAAVEQVKTGRPAKS